LIAAVAATRVGSPLGLGEDGQSLVLFFPPAVIALLAARKMYRSRLQIPLLEGVFHIIGATSTAAALLIAAAAFLEPDADPAGLIARTWVFSTAYVAAGRLLLARSQTRARRSGLIEKRTLIVGAGIVGCQVERRLREQPQLGLRPVGYIDADPSPEEMVSGRSVPVLGGPAELERILDETGAQHVVIGFSTAPDSSYLPLIRRCEERNVEVTLVPRMFDTLNLRVDLQHIGGLPLFALHAVRPRGFQFAVKHAFDRIAGGVILALLSPVIATSALAVRLSSRGPVFFRQSRMGRDGRPFEMLKFRSMRISDPAAALPDEWITANADLAPGGVEGDKDRRTKAGSFLRRTSLDELPQLFNVLKGEMSLVGPRPERPEFVEAFEGRVRRYEDRHRVKAGITGWAQVNGLRGKTSLADRIEWDNFYIENWSLLLDVKILALTVIAPFQNAE